MKDLAQTVLTSVPPVVLFMGGAVSVLALSLLKLNDMLQAAL